MRPCSLYLFAFDDSIYVLCIPPLLRNLDLWLYYWFVSCVLNLFTSFYHHRILHTKRKHDHHIPLTRFSTSTRKSQRKNALKLCALLFPFTSRSMSLFLLHDLVYFEMNFSEFVSFSAVHLYFKSLCNLSSLLCASHHILLYHSSYVTTNKWSRYSTFNYMSLVHGAPIRSDIHLKWMLWILRAQKTGFLAILLASA